MRKLTSLALGVGTSVLAAGSVLPVQSADAAVLGTENSVVVLRVGEGSTSLAGTAARVYLEEYAITYTGNTPSGATHVQTIPINHTSVDPNAFGTKLTLGGTASLEGGLNFTTDGQYLMFGGYHAEVGVATSGNRKIIGRMDLNGDVSFDAVYGTGTTAANVAPRGVASTDGNSYYLGMSNNSTSGGTHYRTWEGGNNTLVNSTQLTAQNTRKVEIYNGQLYMTSAATNVSSIFGVATVGSGLPTGASSVTILPGMPTATGPSPYDFWFADDNTVYVADDRTGVTTGGLQKWALESGTWVLKYTKPIDTVNDALDNGLRGLTGAVDASGNVTLFGTTNFSATVSNFLVGISDTLSNTDPANVTVNSLASSAAIPGSGGVNANFRGLEDINIVVPEPASLGLLAGGLLVLAGRRRRA